MLNRFRFQCLELGFLRPEEGASMELLKPLGSYLPDSGRNSRPTPPQEVKCGRIPGTDPLSERHSFQTLSELSFSSRSLIGMQRGKLKKIASGGLSVKKETRIRRSVTKRRLPRSYSHFFADS
jgi:hypothetical protein